MRCPRWLITSLLLAPSLASAQVFAPPPPHVYVRQRIQWHIRRHQRPIYVAPVAPPVWVAPATPPPPVYVSPPPLVHIEPQQPAYVQPQPIYEPPCCYQAPPPPAPVLAAPLLVAPAPAKPQWHARFGLGATVEGVIGRGDSETRGFGVLGQLRYRTSRHTGLELMGGYQRSTVASGLTRSDVPITFGLLIPFLGPEYVFSPYLVVAAGVDFARLRLDSPGLTIDERRVQGIAQLGGGFELRLSQRFAINTDARVEGRWNVGDRSEDAAARTVKIDGQVVDPFRNSVALRLGLGASVYF